MSAVEQHAAGIKSWVSPANSFWFALEPDDAYGQSDEIIAWHNAATQIFEKIIANSNFHAEDLEAITDGAAFGTRAILINEKELTSTNSKPFVCQRWEIPGFSMLENSDGNIDTNFNTRFFTPRQAMQQFGTARLPQAVLDKISAGKLDDTQEKYIHGIYPRDDDEYDSRLVTADNFPVASCWVHESSKAFVKESGFFEAPTVVSRHQKWGGTPYGIPPAIRALADARQLNSLQCSLDLLADVAANPRLLIPVEMEGNVNLMPGGATFYGSKDRLPTAWGDQGKYAEGAERVRMRRADIERALNIEIFRTFRNITKEISATEATYVRQEAIDLFSPTFSLLDTEHYQKILQRMFSIALKKGMFPQMPEGMLIDLEDGVGVMPPKVRFTSRMALAVAQRHRDAIDDSIRRRVEVGNIIGPAAFDDLKIPEALKLIDREQGLPFDLHRTKEETDQLQEARAQQQAQQAQMEMAEKAASAAGKLKGTGILEQATA
jgi:hypothetical protein